MKPKKNKLIKLDYNFKGHYMKKVSLDKTKIRPHFLRFLQIF